MNKVTGDGNFDPTVPLLDKLVKRLSYHPKKTIDINAQCTQRGVIMPADSDYKFEHFEEYFGDYVTLYR